VLAARLDQNASKLQSIAQAASADAPQAVATLASEHGAQLNRLLILVQQSATIGVCVLLPSSSCPRRSEDQTGLPCARSIGTFFSLDSSLQMPVSLHRKQLVQTWVLVQKPATGQCKWSLHTKVNAIHAMRCESHAAFSAPIERWNGQL